MPAEAISVAGTVAFNWVLETKVVVRAVPFHWTTELETKFTPVAVSVKAGPPASAEVGETLLSVGVPDVELMVKVAALEIWLFWLTVTWAVPGLAMSVAGTVAVSLALETNMVVRAVPFQLTVAPLAVALLTKFEP